MKHFIFILLFFLSCCLAANASEVIGEISTDPAKNKISASSAGGGTHTDSINKPVPAFSAPTNSGAAWLYSKKQNNSKEVDGIHNVRAEKNLKVLGIAKYPDKSLLRGSDKKIYLVMDKTKKHIVSLAELEKYRGQIIYDVEDKILSEYETRRHLDGELIRQIGTVKVYVVKQGAKHHILNLEELRRHYLGMEIFNISREEMMKY